MSMPEATPAEVMTPSSTTRESRSTVTPAPRESRRSSAAQWVVARRPARRPALARRSAPVQTEVTCRAPAAALRIQPRVSTSWRRGRVPKRPGTTRRSMAGASAKLWVGTTTSAPVAVIGSRVLTTVKTWKGALSSDLRASAPGIRRVRENTSNGPAKSNTSTPSKIRMPTLIFSISSPYHPLIPWPLPPPPPFPPHREQGNGERCCFSPSSPGVVGREGAGEEGRGGEGLPLRAEGLHPEHPVVAAGAAEGEVDAQLFEGRIEDVPAMAGAAQP